LLQLKLTCWPRTYVVHSKLADEIVPKLLTGELDKECYSREWFDANYETLRAQHPVACFWPR
jgi:hypothetical protein